MILQLRLFAVVELLLRCYQTFVSLFSLTICLNCALICLTVTRIVKSDSSSFFSILRSGIVAVVFLNFGEF